MTNKSDPVTRWRWLLWHWGAKAATVTGEIEPHNTLVLVTVVSGGAGGNNNQQIGPRNTPTLVAVVSGTGDVGSDNDQIQPLKATG